jgi:hypothetical protein
VLGYDAGGVEVTAGRADTRMFVAFLIVLVLVCGCQRSDESDLRSTTRKLVGQFNEVADALGECKQMLRECVDQRTDTDAGDVIGPPIPASMARAQRGRGFRIGFPGWSE